MKFPDPLRCSDSNNNNWSIIWKLTLLGKIKIMWSQSGKHYACFDFLQTSKESMATLIFGKCFSINKKYIHIGGFDDAA